MLRTADLDGLEGFAHLGRLVRACIRPKCCNPSNPSKYSGNGAFTRVNLDHGSQHDVERSRQAGLHHARELHDEQHHPTRHDADMDHADRRAQRHDQAHVPLPLIAQVQPPGIDPAEDWHAVVSPAKGDDHVAARTRFFDPPHHDLDKAGEQQ